jgi:beta-glucanase (GH16 family)
MNGSEMVPGTKRWRRRGIGVASVLVAGLAVGGAVVAGLGAQAQSGVQAASGPVADWRLVWSDEFDGSTLDTTKWGTCFPTDRWTPDNCTIDGGGGADREAATSEGAKVEVSGGALHLWAEKRAQTSSITGNTYQYRSAMVQGRRALSAPNANVNVWETSPVADESAWTHVYVETRIKIPNGIGLWPSFWLMPADGRLGPGRTRASSTAWSTCLTR